MPQSNCILSTSFSVGCRSNSGGIDTCYLVNHEKLTVTKDTEGIITSLGTPSATFEFQTYQLQKNISSLTENISMTPENETVVYAPELNIVINKLTTEMRNELALIAKSLIIAIVKDLNGKYWIVGLNRGLDFSSGIRQTGVAIGDRNGTEFTLIGSEPEPFTEIDFAAFSSLIA
jgi:hypothetical protein